MIEILIDWTGLWDAYRVFLFNWHVQKQHFFAPGHPSNFSDAPKQSWEAPILISMIDMVIIRQIIAIFMGDFRGQNGIRINFFHSN